MKDYTRRLPSTTPRRWLRALRREAEDRAARLGPLAGPIRPAQRPWSAVLDRIEALSQEAL